MNSDSYKTAYRSPLVVKDRPHRDMTATRGDYGLPLPDQANANISYSEKQSLYDEVEISQPNIEQVEIIAM